MAAAGAPLPPWHPGNTEEEDLIYRSDLAKALDEAGPTLAANLKLDNIWLHLRRLQVLELTDEERIQNCGARPDQVPALLSFIKKGPRWHYHALMRAMALTGQVHLIAKGGPGREVYIDHETVQSEPKAEGYSPEAEEGSQEPLEQDLLRAIYNYCQYCKRCLMRRHIFAFDDDPGADYIDITPCYIDVWPHMKDGNRVMVPISATKILEKVGKSDRPLIIRLYAQPGDGKTSFTMNVVHSWSIAFMEQVTEKDGKLFLKSKCPLWTMMVFIKARDIKTTVEDAIREELGYEEENGQIMMAHVRNGVGVAIFVEAIDELHDPEAIEKLKKYVRRCKKKGGPTVFITSRTDLCCIDGKDFDRFLTLEGFSEEQALQYVKVYTESCEVPQPTASPLPSQVFEHVTRHKEKMKAVLSNPLQLHLYCALVMRGEIELSETDQLNIPKLFCPLERYLLRRGGVEVTEEQSNSFYKFCMHAILNDLREFPEALLDEFNIVQSYYVFLNKSDQRGHDGRLEAYYSFGHEMVLEFFVSRYIYSLDPDEWLSLILVACCDETWRNIQTIIFQMLVEEGDAQMQLMLTMVCSILVLQYKGSCEEPESIIADLMQLREHIKSVIPQRGTLCSKDGKFVVRDVGAICEKINDAFKEHADQLRAANWLSGVHTCDESSAFDHVLACLKSCPLQVRMVLIKNTICHLMPGKLMPNEFSKTSECWFYPVGDARWAIVNSMENLCTIAAWCPADATEALLREAAIHPRDGSLKDDSLLVGCDCFSDLWGPTDKIIWSKEQWRRFLHMASQWTTGFLNMRFNEETTHLPTLFSCIQSNVKQVSHFIVIEGGKAKLDNLMTWVSRCRQAGVDLSIRNTHVFVTGRSEEKETHSQNNAATQNSEIQVMLKDWTSNSFRIDMDEQTPLAEVLPCILDRTEELAECEEITVVGGTTNINDLISWKSQCKQKGFKLELQQTQLLVVGSSRDMSVEHRHPATKRPGLEVVLSEWTKDGLTLKLEEQTPLVDLLSHLLDHSKHLTDCARITVVGGTARLDDLMTWLSRYKELGLYLSLREVHVLVTENIKTKIDIVCQMKYTYHRGRCTRTEGQTILLKVVLESQTLLTDVLPHMLDHAEYLSQCEEIDVNGGTAEMGDLMSWLSRCRQKGLKLKLQNTHLLVSESGWSENKTSEERHSVTPRPALKVVLTEWTRDWSRLQIDLTEKTSPADLMWHLLDHAEYLSQFEKIELHHGSSQLGALVTGVSQCKEAGLKLELHSTNVRSEQLRIQENYRHDLETILSDKTLSGDEYPTKIQIKHWTPDTLKIDLCKTGPLTGLLSCLQEHAVHFSQCKNIALYGGIADIKDLVTCLSKSKQRGLSFTLYNTGVIVSSEWRKQQEMVDQSLDDSPKEVLQIGRIHTDDELCFSIGTLSTMSPVGLLLHLSHCADQLSQWHEIDVMGGRADLEDLMHSVTRCHQAGLHLALYDVSLSENILKHLDNATEQIPCHVKVKEWYIKHLDIEVEETTPLTGLLSSLLENASHMPLVKEITVHRGTIELPDMVLCMSKDEKAGLHLKFRDTHVVVPDRLLTMEDTSGGPGQISSTNHPVQITITGYSVTTNLLESTPLTTLLSWLIEHLVPLSYMFSITMQGGTAEPAHLMSLLSRCKEAFFKLKLVNVHIVLSKGTQNLEHKTCQLDNADVQQGVLQLESERQMRIDLDETSSLTCLQSWLSEYATQLSRYNCINVRGGRTELGDLLTWVSRCKETGLRLELNEVHVLISRAAKDKVSKQCELSTNPDSEAVLQLKVTWQLEGTVFIPAYRLGIALDRTTPLADILPCLLEETARLSESKSIAVHSGTARFRDLISWVSDEQRGKMQLEFYETNLIVAEAGTGYLEDKAGVILKEWVDKRVRIYLPKNAPLMHILPCLLDHAVHLSQYGSIVVENATATLIDLVMCISKCRLEGVLLTLSDTGVNVSAQQKIEVDKQHQSQNDSQKEGFKLKTVVSSKNAFCMSIVERGMTSLTNLLSELSDCSEHLSEWQLIRVTGGMAELSELDNCVTRFQQTGLQLMLCDVVLSEELTVQVYGGTRGPEHKTCKVHLVIKEWYREHLHIPALPVIALTGLLTDLYDHTVNLSSVKEIAVSDGTVELDDLVPLVGKYEKAGLKLTLPNTNIIVPEELKSKTANYGELSVTLQTQFPVVIVEWVGECLEIQVDETVSLTGLLSHFDEHAAGLSSVKKLVVSRGLVELTDVVPWISKFELVGIDLTWCHTKVVLPEKLKVKEDMHNEPKVTPVPNRMDNLRVINGRAYFFVQETVCTLNPVVRKCSRHVVSIILPKSTPLASFLEYLHAIRFSHWRRITVKYGTAELDDLMTWLFWYKLDGLDLEVLNASIAVPDQITTECKHEVLQMRKLELIGDKVMIELHETTSLTCLLSCLINLAPCLSWYDIIDVKYGEALLEDLLTYVSSCMHAGLELELHDICLHLPKLPSIGEAKHPELGRIYDWEKDHQAKIARWGQNMLTIDLDLIVPVTDLLTVLLAHAVHLSHYKWILVLHGTAELHALMASVCQCRQAGLKLQLGNTYVTGQDNWKYEEIFPRSFYRFRQHGMDMKWMDDSLILTLPTAAPLKDLLSSLLDQTPHLTKCEEIIVKYGTAELDQLMACVSRYEAEGLRLRLCEPYVIVSDEPLDKAHSFEHSFRKDPGIRVMIDGWEIHAVLF